MAGHTESPRHQKQVVGDAYTKEVEAKINISQTNLPSQMESSTVLSSERKVERGFWSHKLEFLLSSFSYGIGLGTIWRFPYLCYRNGGGAFLFPYILMFMFAGLPLFFFETAFGQFGREGPVSIWKVAPLFQGIGYAMFLISVFIGLYYNVVIAWSFRYLFASMTDLLPWSSCNNVWNTPNCRDFDVRNCTRIHGLVDAKRHCFLRSQTNETFWKELQTSYDNSRLPADEYFHKRVLNISDGLDELGPINWEVALCLLLAWICVALVLFKGIESFGKAVYFTAIFPYIILAILLIRSATLPGFENGVKFYLSPQWEKLKEPGVWRDAAMQIFFSLGPCWGGVITLASYNRFNNNCFRDAMLIGLGNVVSGLFAGLVIFGIIGFMAFELGTSVENVATQGAGLAFSVYPEAVARLPVAPLWSILFFVMLLTLGLGTQFTILETVVTTIVDIWPEKLRGRNRKWVLFGAAISMFLLGLIMCTNGGMYVLQLIDNFAPTFSTLVVSLTEVMVISWYYGIDRFLDDIKIMLGRDVMFRSYWKFVWKYLAPLIIVILLISTGVDLPTLEYGNYIYPTWATAVGLLMAFTCISMIPLVAAYKLRKVKGRAIEKIRTLMKPSSDWGPPTESKEPKYLEAENAI